MRSPLQKWFLLSLCMLCMANTEKIVIDQIALLPSFEAHSSVNLVNLPYETAHTIMHDFFISHTQTVYYQIVNPGFAFEFRISYPASSPSDFMIKAFESDAASRVVSVEMKSIGVPISYDPTLYSIQLDRLYLHVIPHSALGVVGLCILWASVGAMVAKRVVREINAITCESKKL